MSSFSRLLKRLQQSSSVVTLQLFYISLHDTLYLLLIPLKIMTSLLFRLVDVYSERPYADVLF